VRSTARYNNNARFDLEKARLNLRTAESSDRGYFMTGDPDFFARYRTATAAARSDMTSLISDAKNTSCYSDVQALAPMVKAKLANMDENVRLFQNGGPEATGLKASFEQGKAEMDNISQAADEISTDQTTQLSNDQASVGGLAALARDISVATLAITLLLAVTVNYLYVKAIEAERRLDRAKDEFVSLASHQLRTPATGVKSILSTLVAGDFGALTDRQAYFVNKALDSNERELSIIEELLNVAKADAGKLVLNPSQLDLVALVGTVVGEQRRAIEAKHISLKLEKPQQPVVIEADQEKLYMALSNLLDNARKYTPEGGTITVRVTARRQLGAAVEIADTGIGIEPSELGHIFDRFGRTSSALQSHVDGAGLGLYLTHRIAELHQGSVDVDSQIGRGSRFTVILPEARA
jgi:signal transduction histidine kinase